MVLIILLVLLIPRVSLFNADVTTEMVEQWSADEKATCVNLGSQADCKYLN